jgi:nitrite reductase/ring-hydroxylating ferredoxin subunit
MELPLVRPGESICGAGALEDGTSLKFRVLVEGRPVEAFLIRFGGRYYAYRNRCAHMALGLDMADNDFFTVDGRALICKTHAAMYDPETGECFAGPCYGMALDALAIDATGASVRLAAPGA